ncbi:MAG: hypothetical protein ABIY70_08910 [Capsulimonas sp.]|uniref:hypothetical protein n=1 Tax=Capsulimonas sp. TaxID=2494211 RepID=UPI0032634CB8
MLLSQIVFYHIPYSDGNSRLNVQRDGFEWLAKKRSEWWKECRITPKQFDRASAALEAEFLTVESEGEDKGLIVTRVYRFEGETVKHVRVNWEVFLPALAQLAEQQSPTKVTKRASEGNSRIDQRGIRESTKAAPGTSPNGDSGVDDSAIASNKNQIQSQEKNLKRKTSTLNVGKKDGLKYSPSLERAEAVRSIVDLTGDAKSTKRFDQLYQIADAAGELDCWNAAAAQLKAKLKNNSLSVPKPGAYFNTTVGAILRDRGVMVPAGSAEERSEVKGLIQDSFGFEAGDNTQDGGQLSS